MSYLQQVLCDFAALPCKAYKGVVKLVWKIHMLSTRPGHGDSCDTLTPKVGGDGHVLSAAWRL